MEYLRPNSIDEACSILNSNSNAIVFAGATDLIPQLRGGRAEPQILIDLKKIPSLMNLSLSTGTWKIGAATPVFNIKNHSKLTNEFPGLSEASGLIGSDQIQTRASLGGNLCTGSPGAGELGFVHYVREFASDQIEAIQSELDMLGQESQDQYKSTFADLSQNDREFLVDLLRKKNAQFAQSIVVQTMACYYQDDKVMIALGIEARPPFPKGNEVTSGDLSLLNPVRERKHIYRDV